jgi:LysM repeat protein
VIAIVAASATLGALGACTSDSPSESTPRTALPPLTTAAPTTAAPTTTIVQFYEIQRGDSLTGIADKFGVDLAQLIALNKIKDPNKIRAGQKLRMPPITVLLNGSTTAAPTSATTTIAHP